MTAAYRDARHQPTIAYFSMEAGLDPAMPTYSGGLGVLAGDNLRAAADLGVPMVGVTFLHRKGYFRQHLDASGNQTESPYNWSPEGVLEPMEPSVVIKLQGQAVHVRAWRYIVRGMDGDVVSVYLLDTADPRNSPWHQSLTDYLYGGDSVYRLCQEAVLGMAGVAILEALGHDEILTFHMNEGHSALLALALLEKQLVKTQSRAVTKREIEAVQRQCVFTTHTPVPAGHDRFPMDLVRQVLGPERAGLLQSMECCAGNELNLTYLALYCSRFINGVSIRHEEISRSMFPHYPITSVTNGVHAGTWTAAPFQRLFDRYIPQWRRDNRYLRHAVSFSPTDIQAAHSEAKRDFLAEVERRTRRKLDPAVMTIGFARRATPYKRADLLFSDVSRLARIAREYGPLQIIYGGKAHPRDEAGKDLIRRIFKASATLGDTLRVLYLEEYDMALAKYLCSGVDLWLNTPMKPQEASGTSGMKAALNGVPSLSVLDGWWVEGHVEGVTGWAIGKDYTSESNAPEEAASLYDKLEYLVLPMYYNRPNAYAEVMRSAIALNGSFFNAHRMVSQYVDNAYRLI